MVFVLRGKTQTFVNGLFDLPVRLSAGDKVLLRPWFRDGPSLPFGITKSAGKCKSNTPKYNSIKPVGFDLFSIYTMTKMAFLVLKSSAWSCLLVVPVCPWVGHEGMSAILRSLSQPAHANQTHGMTTPPNQLVWTHFPFTQEQKGLSFPYVLKSSAFSHSAGFL